MKYYHIAKAMLVLFILQLFCFRVLAAPVSVKVVDDEVPANLNLQVFDTPTIRSGLDEATVRSDGWFAVASMNRDIHDDNKITEKYIDVYDAEGTFCFSLQFYTTGVFEMEFTEGSLDIHIWPHIISYDLSTGKAFVYQSQMDQDETIEYFSHEKLEANGWKYHFMGLESPYTAFVRSNGSETQVLVETAGETAGDVLSGTQILIRGGGAALIAVAATIVFLRIKRKKQDSAASV